MNEFDGNGWNEWKNYVLIELRRLADAVELQHIEYSVRLGKLENWRWYIVGGGSAVIIILGILINI